MKRLFAVARPTSTLRFAARTLTLGILLLSGLGTAPRALAQHASPVSVTSVDAESIRVRIDNAAGQPGRVQVLNLTSGQVLFDEAYSATAYGHRFNFRQLPAGPYALLLRAAGTQYRYTLQVQDGAAGTSVALRTIKARLPKQALAAADL
ncbi:hypothetical protein [Hymenobacter persicinus]|uniref:Uncharacterized protein n=1 Tax=Hymenobacter persicinus TaxID=2025506 RepID=A0A4Q5LEF6_9BACT|nr:hypothetical protein [Hymenobacter persicinus]RYU81002.1 hypothetical protein EWM57_07105 [Hymenobacter persicinus]